MKHKKNKTKKTNLFFKPVLIFLFLIFIAVVAFKLIFINRIYPNIIIGSIKVGSLTKTQALLKLNNSFRVPDKISLKYQNESYDIPLEGINLNYDSEASVNVAFNFGRVSPGLEKVQQILILAKKPFFTKLSYSLNQEVLNEYLSTISSKTSVDPIYPKATIIEGQIVITNGLSGDEVDVNSLRNEINQMFESGNFSEINIKTKPVKATLSESEIKQYKNNVSVFLGKKILLEAEGFLETIPEDKLIDFVSPFGGFYSNKIEELVNQISNKINRDPQNSVFRYQNQKIEEFVPASDGLRIKESELNKLIQDNLYILSTPENKETKISIPLFRITPAISNKDVNDLGINELLGTGTSRFKGSISSRIHNVNLASSKVNGYLLAPGEIFSFNSAVGDVSSLTGYKQAYIIRDGKTTLGDGGGVCQVSTTLFRAVLNSGLPIIERAAHSYRVGYYEQDSPPGLDATVYSPTTDFKFKNDTPGHLLIQVIFEPKNYRLTFEIYGTNDGRVATTTRPVISNITPPPEDLYIDDPTLPTGKIQQIDYKAWGAKVIFDYQVERSGEIIYQKKFISNYKPWQAKFLRGTGL